MRITLKNDVQQVLVGEHAGDDDWSFRACDATSKPFKAPGTDQPGARATTRLSLRVLDKDSTCIPWSSRPPISREKQGDGSFATTETAT